MTAFARLYPVIERNRFAVGAEPPGGGTTGDVALPTSEYEPEARTPWHCGLPHGPPPKDAAPPAPAGNIYDQMVYFMCGGTNMLNIVG